jgi:hypothetical protein
MLRQTLVKRSAHGRGSMRGWSASAVASGISDCSAYWRVPYRRDADGRHFVRAVALAGVPASEASAARDRTFFIAGVHACPHMFIGQLLDTGWHFSSNLLILLALPRGLEPLFSP